MRRKKDSALLAFLMQGGRLAVSRDSVAGGDALRTLRALGASMGGMVISSLPISGGSRTVFTEQELADLRGFAPVQHTGYPPYTFDDERELRFGNLHR